MKLPTSLRWIALALLGLVIAGAVALAAGRLASQQIGIASESVSAGDSLAPPVTSVGRPRGEDRGKEGTDQPAEGEEHPESTGGQGEPAEEPPESSEPAPTETSEPSPTESSPPPTQGDDGGGGGGGGEGADD
jgi:hypothetical protein